MRIQHNITAMNSYRNFSANNSNLSKNLEKLSSGYKINRAGDDAAGLAISEKMRAQITGLEGAKKNATDGISLIQTAEGALTEVHDMLNRMTTLAEQSANGTYESSLDRVQLNKEITSLKDEIDRIADSTNFNGLYLLDGSLDADFSNYSSTISDVKNTVATIKSTDNAALESGTFNAELTVTNYNNTSAKAEYTDALGTQYAAFNTFTAGTVQSVGGQSFEIGAESYTAIDQIKDWAAAWNANEDNEYTVDVSELTMATGNGDTATSATYVSSSIVIASSLDTSLTNGLISVGGRTLTSVNLTSVTDADTLASAIEAALAKSENKVDGWDGTVTVTSTTSGSDSAYNIQLTYTNKTAGRGVATTASAKSDIGFTAGTFTDGNAGKLNGDITWTARDAGTVAGSYGPSAVPSPLGASAATVATTGADGNITAIFSLKVGDQTYKATVNTSDPTALDEGTVLTLSDNDGNTVDITVGNVDRNGTTTIAKTTTKNVEGNGLTLQIGDTADTYNTMTVAVGDMHVKTLNIDDVDISTQETAAQALDKIKSAINQVSDVRGTLGALQNRLDHTINNLGVMRENIQNAESNIRDTDVAEEMMTYTKNSILNQSAQAMLAQANQLPQGVLQLLQ